MVGWVFDCLFVYLYCIWFVVCLFVFCLVSRFGWPLCVFVRIFDYFFFFFFSFVICLIGFVWVHFFFAWLVCCFVLCFLCDLVGWLTCRSLASFFCILGVNLVNCFVVFCFVDCLFIYFIVVPLLVYELRTEHWAFRAIGVMAEARVCSGQYA